MKKFIVSIFAVVFALALCIAMFAGCGIGGNSGNHSSDNNKPNSESQSLSFTSESDNQSDSEEGEDSDSESDIESDSDSNSESENESNFQPDEDLINYESVKALYKNMKSEKLSDEDLLNALQEANYRNFTMEMVTNVYNSERRENDQLFKLDLNNHRFSFLNYDIRYGNEYRIISKEDGNWYEYTKYGSEEWSKSYNGKEGESYYDTIELLDSLLSEQYAIEKPYNLIWNESRKLYEATNSEGFDIEIKFENGLISAIAFDSLVDGERMYIYCILHSYNETIVTIPEGHIHCLIRHDGKDATCTESGWKYYETCLNCDYTTYEEIPATGHNFNYHTSQAPTCTEVGWDTYKVCENCGYSTYKEIPATGHTFSYYTGKEATCTESGWNNYKVCDICGYSTYQEIPYKHDEIYHAGKPATCLEDGYKDYVTCSRCDYTSYEEIPAFGHDYISGICSRCGDIELTDTKYFTFTLLSDDTYSVSANESYMSSLPLGVRIPSRYNGKAVTTIEYAAFYFSNLMIAIIPDSVTNIESRAFLSCSYLMSVTIPNSVTSIGESPFRWCGNLEEIIVAEDNERYCVIDNCLIDKTTKTLLKGYKNSTIPTDGSVTIIGEGAFQDCINLTSVVIPNGVTSIGDYAFFWCVSLASVTIPNSVTNIGDSAFQDCDITSVTIPNSVTNIESSAFANCDKLKEIIVAAGNKRYYATNNCLIDKTTKTLIQGCYTSIIPTDGSVTSIGYGAFYGCSELAKVVIPNSVTTIEDDAFYECSGMKSVTIPDSVTSIGSNAFNRCGGLNEIIVEADNERYSGSGNCLIDKESKILILGCNNSVIPTDGSVAIIGYEAFANCNGLTSIDIPDGVTSIDYQAFVWCDSLTSITIPKSLKSIDNDAFRSCDNLYKIINNSDLDITLGSSDYGGIAENAKILIDKNGNIITSDGYEMQNDFLFKLVNNKYTLIAYIGNEETITLPSDINGQDYTIYYMRGVKNVIIPNGMTCISDYAFRDCVELISVTIPNGVTSIGNGAFDGCTGLTNITIPDSVTSIEDWAFAHCTGLTNVTIGKNVTRIGHYAFYWCPNLTSIIIPNNVTFIGEWAFNACHSLTSITIPDRVSSIGSAAFANCNGLKKIIVSSGNKTYYVKNNCLIDKTTKTLIKGFNNSVIPTDGSVTSIGEEAFSHCDDLTNITIPDSVTIIGRSAFFDCESLASITLPDRLTSIENDAFYACYSLTNITISNNITSIEYNAFAFCRSLTTINFKGTKAEWKAIYKEDNWNWETGDYTVYCTDGKLDKYDNEID